MTIASYLNQLLQDGQFWFLKESAMDLWLLDRNPIALPYLAVAYCCLGEPQTGKHWFQMCLKTLPPEDQEAVVKTISPLAPAEVTRKIRLMMHQQAA